MNKTIILSIALLGLTANAAMAREISTTMTKDQFHAACKNGTGRTYVNHTADTASCVLADGTIIYCNFSTGTCDVPRGVKLKSIKQLLGDRSPNSVDSNSGNTTPKADSGGNIVGGDNNPGAGGDGGPAVK